MTLTDVRIFLTGKIRVWLTSICGGRGRSWVAPSGLDHLGMLSVINHFYYIIINIKTLKVD